MGTESFAQNIVALASWPAGCRVVFRRVGGAQCFVSRCFFWLVPTIPVVSEPGALSEFHHGMGFTGLLCCRPLGIIIIRLGLGPRGGGVVGSTAEGQSHAYTYAHARALYVSLAQAVQKKNTQVLFNPRKMQDNDTCTQTLPVPPHRLCPLCCERLEPQGRSKRASQRPQPARNRAPQHGRRRLAAAAAAAPADGAASLALVGLLLSTYWQICHMPYCNIAINIFNTRGRRYGFTGIALPWYCNL